MPGEIRKWSRLNSLDRDRTATPGQQLLDSNSWTATPGPSRTGNPKPNSKLKVELHEIDSHGDLLMQLFRNAGSENVFEVASEDESSATDDGEEVDAESVGENGPDTGDQAGMEMDVNFPEDDDMETEDEAEESGSEDEDTDVDCTNSEASDPGPQPVHIRVSSKNMIMASPFFRSMLDNDRFEEGSTLHSKGSVEIPFPEDNPDAFLILLKIIHGMTRQVPREVDFDMMNELAILVDKYQVLEIVEPFSEIWIQKLEDSMEGVEEGEYAMADYLPWLSIYWVFERDQDFHEMTVLLQNDCDEKLEKIDEKGRFHISEAVISAIKESRISKINATLDVIYERVEKFAAEEDNECEEGSEKDRFTCDAMMLGSLLKGAAQIGIWPKLEAPYIGQTFHDLRANLLEMKLTDLSNYKRAHPDHGYTKIVSMSIKALEDQYNGVKLWDIKQRR